MRRLCQSFRWKIEKLNEYLIRYFLREEHHFSIARTLLGDRRLMNYPLASAQNYHHFFNHQPPPIVSPNRD